MASPTDPSVLTQVFGNDIRKDFAPLYPAWLRLSEKFKAGIATPTEIDELDRLNQIILNRGPANNNKSRVSSKGTTRGGSGNALSQQDRETLAYTLLGEAGGEGRRGMEAVAWTIRNRSESGRYSSNPAAVARQPLQYSTWNRGEGGNNPTRYSRNSQEFQNALAIVDDVFAGRVQDPTGGATHFYAPSGMEGGRAPNWWSSELANAGGQPVRIGGHIFAGGNALDAVNRMAGDQPRTAMAYAGAPSREIAPVPIPRPAPRLPPLMDEVTGNPLGNPLFPLNPPSQRPPAGDGSRVQTADLSPGPTPTQAAGLNLINGAQGTLATLAKRVLPPAPVINSGSFGGSLNMESQSLPMTNKVAGDKLASNAASTLSGLANMPRLPVRDTRFSNPEWNQANPSMPGIGLGMDMPTPRIADVGSHLAPIPPPRPDNTGTGGPDLGFAPTPPPRPGTPGTRSNPVGSDFTPAQRPASLSANDPLVTALNSAFPPSPIPRPLDVGTGGPLAAPLPPPSAAPRPSSFAPGSPEIARMAALYAPFARQMAPVTQQPVPLPIPRSATVAAPRPAVSQAAPLAAVMQQVRASIPSRPERGSAAASGGSLARDRAAGAKRYWNPTERRWVSL